MKKLSFILICFLLKSMLVLAQDTLTLETCQQKSLEFYPSQKQKELINSIYVLKAKTLDINYLPQVSLNGQATYQSDVTQVNLPIPNITMPSLDKDQYKIYFDVSQVLYDGGTTKTLKTLNDLSAQVEQKTLEIELYKVKEKVTALYFSIILVQENVKLLNIIKAEIQSKLLKVESGVKNGVLTESNADILNAEILKIEQQVMEAKSSIDAGYIMLGDYMNIVVDSKTVLKIPAQNITSTDFSNSRPEAVLFENQQKKLEFSKKLSDVKQRPKLAAFGQAGYGKPGLNMFSSTFDSYYMVGAKLSWSFLNWNQKKNDVKIIDLQNNMLTAQKETFDLGVKILLQKCMADIENYKNQLLKDEAIIELRTKIVKAASSQLENGVITATEYLTELNALTTAKLNYETHKIKLVKAQLDYILTKGN